MSKAQSSNKRSQDRHAAHKMYRLPIDLATELEELATANNRPVTWELKTAVREYIDRTKRKKK